MLLNSLLQVIEPLLILSGLIFKEVIDSTYSRFVVLSMLEQMIVVKEQELITSNSPEFYRYLHIVDSFTERYVVEAVESIKKPRYTESVIGTAELQFIDSLYQKHEDCPIEVPHETQEPSMLSMDDWDEEVTWTTVPLETLAASCKIDDYCLGEQTWMVEVIGEEQNYLHVSDGSARAWVYQPSTNIIGVGDILSVIVNRISHEQVDMCQMDILQKRSIDYLVLDEQVVWEENYLKAANGF